MFEEALGTCEATESGRGLHVHQGWRTKRRLVGGKASSRQPPCFSSSRTTPPFLFGVCGLGLWVYVSDEALRARVSARAIFVSKKVNAHTLEAALPCEITNLLEWTGCRDETTLCLDWLFTAKLCHQGKSMRADADPPRRVRHFAMIIRTHTHVLSAEEDRHSRPW